MHPSTKKLVPKNNYPIRPFLKKRNAEVKEKSIVFKEKGKKKTGDLHHSV